MEKKRNLRGELHDSGELSQSATEENGIREPHPGTERKSLQHLSRRKI
jgi:hypothetical protein